MTEAEFWIETYDRLVDGGFDPPFAVEYADACCAGRRPHNEWNPSVDYYDPPLKVERFVGSAPRVWMAR